jgi:ABC-2 type transport system permease protein
MPLLLKTLRDLRGQVLGWGIGLSLLALIDVAIYPSFSAAFDMQALLEQYPPALRALFGNVSDAASLEGFLAIEFFNFAGFIMAIFPMTAGSGALAAEEERGTMDLLLAQPISRQQVVLQKAAAIVLATLITLSIVAATFVVSLQAYGLDIDPARVVVAVYNIAPLLLAIAGLSMWAGTWLPSRRMAAMTVAFVVILGWFINGLAELAESVRPFRPLSLFRYYASDEVLRHGVDWSDNGVLLAVGLVSLLLTVVMFQRRDIALGSEGGWRLPRLFQSRPAT